MDTHFLTLFSKFWDKDYWDYEQYKSPENEEKCRKMMWALVTQVRSELLSGEVSQKTMQLCTQRFTAKYLSLVDGAPIEGGLKGKLNFYEGIRNANQK